MHKYTKFLDFWSTWIQNIQNIQDDCFLTHFQHVQQEMGVIFRGPQTLRGPWTLKSFLNYIINTYLATFVEFIRYIHAKLNKSFSSFKTSEMILPVIFKDRQRKTEKGYNQNSLKHKKHQLPKTRVSATNLSKIAEATSCSTLGEWEAESDEIVLTNFWVHQWCNIDMSSNPANLFLFLICPPNPS